MPLLLNSKLLSLRLLPHCFRPLLRRLFYSLEVPPAFLLLQRQVCHSTLLSQRLLPHCFRPLLCRLFYSLEGPPAFLLLQPQVCHSTVSECLQAEIAMRGVRTFRFVMMVGWQCAS